MHKLSILLAQINPQVGKIEENRDKILKIIEENQTQHDLILFPELALTGYPPEDLLFSNDFQERVKSALETIVARIETNYVVLGYPRFEQGLCYNTAAILNAKRILETYDKQALPNYGVFDEHRYFTPGNRPVVLNIKGHKLGLCICEDLWQPGAVDRALAAGATGLLCLNASPFDKNKYEQRVELLRAHALKGLTLFYVNQAGGQDELVFDGVSLAMDKQGKICARASGFTEELLAVTLDGKGVQGSIAPLLEHEARIYEALVCGTGDYIRKNNFPGVLLGLSGGIDSALTMAIASDALGASKVHAVMMPSRFSSSLSYEEAIRQLDFMNIDHTTLAIEPIFQSYIDTLAPVFKDLPWDTTEENLQARIRGNLLMALSNKLGKMVLSTSNKSESAVGYTTLYGDMCGGFAPLKDVLKTEVYALANYRNTLSECIPKKVISRPPTAELRTNQTDQDSLPPYSLLDLIIKAYMEDNLSLEAISHQTQQPETVKKVIGMINRNEYKRRQAPPGVKISSRAFGKDWRYPITK